MSYTPRRFNNPFAKAVMKVFAVIIALGVIANIVRWLVELSGP